MRTQASRCRMWSGVSRGLEVGAKSFPPWAENQVFSWRRVMVMVGLSGMVADFAFIVVARLEKWLRSQALSGRIRRGSGRNRGGFCQGCGCTMCYLGGWGARGVVDGFVEVDEPFLIVLLIITSQLKLGGFEWFLKTIIIRNQIICGF